jgi:hypothetical protein
MYQVFIAHVTHAPTYPPIVYVGRPLTYTTNLDLNPTIHSQVLAGSPLANPYKDRSFAVRFFEAKFNDLLLEKPHMAEEYIRLLSLLYQQKQLTLACWCAKQVRSPYPDPVRHTDGCHADVIGSKLLNFFGMPIYIQEQASLF